MNLSLRHLRLLALAGAFLLGLSSPVQAGDSEHGTCTIDMQHDTVTCTHNGTQWTCRDKGDQTWSWTQGEGFARRAAARRIMEVSMTMSDGSERCAFTGFRPVTATIAVITAFRIKDETG